jgi:hypothetical protein
VTGYKGAVRIAKTAGGGKMPNRNALLAPFEFALMRPDSRLHRL